MFGGIVETVGLVKQAEDVQGNLQLTIAPKTPFTDGVIGESVAVNGVCLTVIAFTEQDFCVTAVPETLRLTNLSILQEGAHVNLERALRLSDRIGGHYVQGHVDCSVAIKDMTTVADNTLLVTFSYPAEYSNLLVKKGYITIDGMSITLVDVAIDTFTVTFIPHTRLATIVQYYQPRTQVNVEFDILGKYISNYLNGGAGKTYVTPFS